MKSAKIYFTVLQEAKFKTAQITDQDKDGNSSLHTLTVEWSWKTLWFGENAHVSSLPNPHDTLKTTHYTKLHSYMQMTQGASMNKQLCGR